MTYSHVQLSHCSLFTYVISLFADAVVKTRKNYTRSIREFIIIYFYLESIVV